MCLECVNGLLRSFVFLYLFDCDCIVCGIGRLRCCVVVLCSLNVFGVCKWIVAFGRVFV